MTTYSIPSGVKIISSRFGLEYNSQVFTSPLSNAQQVLELTGARWTASYTLAVYKANSDAAEEIKSFLMKLRGMANDFNAYDPDYDGARGTVSGAPQVMGGSQTGNSLICDGFANNSNVFKDGDYFSVNGEFKRITQSITSNGSGEATLVFEPPLRNSPSDNAVITYASPVCRMRLVDSGAAVWDSNAQKLQQYTFTGVERIDV